MKLLDVDWSQVFPYAEVWDGLNDEERAEAIAISASDRRDARHYGKALEALEQAEILERFNASEVRPTERFRPALRVLRFAADVPLFAEPELTGEYVNSNLTHDERDALVGHLGWRSRGDIPFLVRSASWVQGFLEAGDKAKWEARRLPHYFPSSHTRAHPVLAKKRAAADVVALVRALMESPDPIPLSDLPGAVGRMSTSRLADAVWTAVRFVLAFVGFDESGRLALGLHPDVSERLHRPPAPEPEPVRPEESFGVAWLVEDVIQLVVYCAEPRRLRSGDASLFAKCERELGALLLPVPEWIAQGDATAMRIEEARRTAEWHDLVEVVGSARARSLQTTELGHAWLAKPAKERARAIIDAVRSTGDENGNEDDEQLWLIPSGLLTGASVLARAFEGLDEPVELMAFLRHRVETRNPHRDFGSLGAHPALTEELLEARWREELVDTIGRTLVPLGGVRLGRAGARGTIELTDVGRYLLGATDRFTWPEVDSSASIVVQPDFEIVFLAPNAALAASFLRFAERIGQGAGALFRLTRTSIQSAARSGLTAREVLETLAESSKTDLPDNVAREIESWCDQTVHLAWETAQLIRCPDEDTAARVLAVAPTRLEPVGPTVLLLKDAKQRSSITNACRKAGVFLDAPAEEAKAKRGRKKKRRRYW